jgi:ABC-type polysaccharide/polyol phosphate transport system ATPase subunit
MAIVEFHDVSKQFIIHHERSRSFQEIMVNLFRRSGETSREEFWALKHVSFQVEPGQTLAIIGTNGSGKSTALKLLSKIIYPTSGAISVRGRVAALLELGTGFHPDLTGRENIFLNGSIIGLSRVQINQRLDKIIQFAELDRFIDVPVRNYSSGMVVRLGFAVATYVDADILLIDEVLAVGDQAFQAKCMQRIHDLQKRGATIVFVSHDLASVQRLCQRAIWLDQGQVYAEGDPRDVITQYMSERGGGKEGWAISSKDAQAKTIRWGSGEITIERFEMLDGQGQPSEVFITGEKMVIRLWYHAKVSVQSPAFGVGIFDENGGLIVSPNCVEDGHRLAVREGGAGYVDYIFDTLPLLTGVYDLTVAIYDKDVALPYDHQHKVAKFMVRDKAIRQRDGKVLLPARWQSSQDGSPGIGG